MQARLNAMELTPEPIAALRGIEGYLRKCGLESALVDLVKMRASQINGCAFCLDMHSKDARAAGETEQRLYLLSAWRETALYSESEQAALALAEELTELPSHESVSDALYARVRQPNLRAMRQPSVPPTASTASTASTAPRTGTAGPCSAG